MTLSLDVFEVDSMSDALLQQPFVVIDQKDPGHPAVEQVDEVRDRTGNGDKFQLAPLARLTPFPTARVGERTFLTDVALPHASSPALFLFSFLGCSPMLFLITVIPLSPPHPSGAGGSLFYSTQPLGIAGICEHS